MRLEKPYQVLVILKVDQSEFGTLNNQRFGFKFIEESVPLRRRGKGDDQEVKRNPHIPRLLRQ